LGDGPQVLGVVFVTEVDQGAVCTVAGDAAGGEQGLTVCGVAADDRLVFGVDELAVVLQRVGDECGQVGHGLFTHC